MFTSDSSQKELFEAIWRMAFIAEYREFHNQAHLERIRGYTFTLAGGWACRKKRLRSFPSPASCTMSARPAWLEPLVLKEGHYTEADLDAAKVHTWLGCEMLKDCAFALPAGGGVHRPQPSRALGWLRLPQRAARRGHPAQRPHRRAGGCLRCPDHPATVQDGGQPGGSPVPDPGGRGARCSTRSWCRCSMMTSGRYSGSAGGSGEGWLVARRQI